MQDFPIKKNQEFRLNTRIQKDLHSFMNYGTIMYVNVPHIALAMET